MILLDLEVAARGWRPKKVVFGLAALVSCLGGWGCDTATFNVSSRGMAPTLLSGDKIAVSAAAYQKSGPKRWDIIVFKYPPDPSRYYVKRVVGLPGESVHIRDGDVYINGKIARKPWPVQDAMWRERAGSGYPASWTADEPGHWQIGHGKLAVDSRGTAEPQRLTYSREILAYEGRELPESIRALLRIHTCDAMVQFVLEPQEMTGAVHVQFDVGSPAGPGQVLDQWAVVVPLDGTATVPRAFRFGEPAANGSACQFARGRGSLVQVCNVDRTLIVRVDGRDVLHHDYAPSQRASALPGLGRAVKVRVGCKGGHVVFREPGIYADVYYTRRPARYGIDSPCALAQDEFFVLGDNGAYSNDSRGWGAVPRKYVTGKAVGIRWPRHRRRALR